MLKRKRSPVSEIQEIDDEGHSHLYHLEEKLQDLFFQPPLYGLNTGANLYMPSKAIWISEQSQSTKQYHLDDTHHLVTERWFPVLMIITIVQCTRLVANNCLYVSPATISSDKSQLGVDFLLFQMCPAFLLYTGAECQMHIYCSDVFETAAQLQSTLTALLSLEQLSLTVTQLTFHLLSKLTLHVRKFYESHCHTDAGLIYIHGVLNVASCYQSYESNTR